MGGCRASWDARSIICRMSASQIQIFCMFLHTLINAQPQKLNVLDTVNASRNRAFAIKSFSFCSLWKCLKEGCCTIFAYTRHAVLFRDARGRHNFRANYVHLPKNTQKMLKTELGNCSPLFALHQLILHRQLLFSAGCRQREKNKVVFRKKD